MATVATLGTGSMASAIKVTADLVTTTVHTPTQLEREDLFGIHASSRLTTSVRPRVYLASPFFNEKQIERIEGIEEALEDLAIDVFSPRKVKYAEEFGTQAWRDKVYRTNVENIQRADFVVAIYDEEDSGTMWEIGYAIAAFKKVIVVKHTDQPVNLMISDSCHAFVNGPEELRGYNFLAFPRIPYVGDVF